eukprot:CAMPEP_0182507512 /NCGR_PEP_ID=MMETSP1321-20130603/23266_1 /TAXON_ID=91990 /ORGANISM="Bolidomonas sp., Strain RCC1657" /LENGTH=160 /DNA_ID=CAMNT_0024713419 /DNA_START=64 /DNA_END=546 /DNA_ORIENTATION=-
MSTLLCDACHEVSLVLLALSYFEGFHLLPVESVEVMQLNVTIARILLARRDSLGNDDIIGDPFRWFPTFHILGPQFLAFHPDGHLGRKVGLSQDSLKKTGVLQLVDFGNVLLREENNVSPLELNVFRKMEATAKPIALMRVHDASNSFVAVIGSASPVFL